MSYPKWVGRGFGIGEVLCLNEEEEAAILKDRAEREKPTEPEEAEPERKKPGPKPKVK